MSTDRPTRATLHAQLIWPRGDRRRPSRGARRHNRKLLAEARKKHGAPLVTKPKPSARETPKKPVIIQIFSTAVVQQTMPGKCPVCTSKSCTSATVKLIDMGTTEQMLHCNNCNYYFRTYTPPAVEPAVPVAPKPTLPEVDDHYLLPVWPTFGCSCGCSTHRPVDVHDRYDGYEKVGLQCTQCSKIYKQRSW